MRIPPSCLIGTDEARLHFARAFNSIDRAAQCIELASCVRVAVSLQCMERAGQRYPAYLGSFLFCCIISALPCKASDTGKPQYKNDLEI